MKYYRVWFWETESKREFLTGKRSNHHWTSKSGWVSKIVHDDYGRAQKELEATQAYAPHWEIRISETDKDGNEIEFEDKGQEVPEIYMKRRPPMDSKELLQFLGVDSETIVALELASWVRSREMAAYRAFRKLVPYLEKKAAKSLFISGRTTTAEAFRRGAEFGRRRGPN